MSITPFDNNEWLRQFFGRNNIMRRDGFFSMDPFRAFEEMEKEMEGLFSQFNEIQSNPPKELVREYQNSDGSKVREVGPIVYGYSMTIGPDGKPKVREFGNIKHGENPGFGKRGLNTTRIHAGPQIRAEREPLADVNVTDSEVKVILEMPGVKKDNIKINALGQTLEVSTNDSQRKYHRTIELPQETDFETAKSTYNNGILEITFSKKKETKSKGKEIKID